MIFSTVPGRVTFAGFWFCVSAMPSPRSCARHAVVCAMDIVPGDAGRSGSLLRAASKRAGKSRAANGPRRRRLETDLCDPCGLCQIYLHLKLRFLRAATGDFDPAGPLVQSFRRGEGKNSLFESSCGRHNSDGRQFVKVRGRLWQRHKPHSNRGKFVRKIAVLAVLCRNAPSCAGCEKELNFFWKSEDTRRRIQVCGIPCVRQSD